MAYLWREDALFLPRSRRGGEGGRGEGGRKEGRGDRGSGRRLKECLAFDLYRALESCCGCTNIVWHKPDCSRTFRPGAGTAILFWYARRYKTDMARARARASSFPFLLPSPLTIYMGISSYALHLGSVKDALATREICNCPQSQRGFPVKYGLLTSEKKRLDAHARRS